MYSRNRSLQKGQQEVHTHSSGRIYKFKIPFGREISVSTLNRYWVETSKCKNSFMLLVTT